jgi:hypothetical protein
MWPVKAYSMQSGYRCSVHNSLGLDILSYEAANTYWELISTDLRNNDLLTWQTLDEKYRAAYKNACTFFREKCPL